MGYLPWDEPAKIEIISGAFMMMRRTALDKAGLLDEDFFMYGEDIDLSYRLLKSGFDNWYLPTKILHYKEKARRSHRSNMYTCSTRPYSSSSKALWPSQHLAEHANKGCNIS